MGIQLNQDHLKEFVKPADIEALIPQVTQAHQDLVHKKGAGHEFTGWLDLPERIPEELLEELTILGEKVREDSDCIISIGIGGSYLGIRATVEYLRQSSLLPVYYAGHNMNPDYLVALLEKLKDKRMTVVVISKSGTTTEPALAFRIVKKFLEEKYSEAQLKERIICVTDAKKGALRQVVKQNGYKSFVIPDDVGGRFSILTPVGLVPLALAGVDIRSLVEGARRGQVEYGQDDFTLNAAHQYAASRYLLYKQGKMIEVLSSFYDNMQFVMEWWKQLYGESEGKDGRGIFPASTVLSADLHSMGQLMQEGVRNIFETFIVIDKPFNTLTIPEQKENLDNFNFIAGKDLDFVNKQAYKATAAAHYEGGVPNMSLTLTQADAFHLGQLYYFFEKAVGISGYLLEVNPFNQPGVEAYKKKMFALLGRE